MVGCLLLLPRPCHPPCNLLPHHPRGGRGSRTAAVTTGRSTAVHRSTFSGLTAETAGWLGTSPSIHSPCPDFPLPARLPLLWGRSLGNTASWEPTPPPPRHHLTSFTSLLQHDPLLGQHRQRRVEGEPATTTSNSSGFFITIPLLFR